MAAIASRPLSHTTSHLNPTGCFWQVKKQRQETKALRKAAVGAGAGVGPATYWQERCQLASAALAAEFMDFFNDCSSPSLFVFLNHAICSFWIPAQ